MQWEALTLLLIGISVNQLHTTQEGTTALAVPIASVAYFYTLVFVSTMSSSFFVLHSISWTVAPNEHCLSICLY